MTWQCRASSYQQPPRVTQARAAAIDEAVDAVKAACTEAIALLSRTGNTERKRITRLPAIRSTTSVWVDCVTWAPLTLTITSFSLIPARWAAPPGRTVCTETGRSPDRVRPKPWSSRVTLRVRVLSAADGIGEDACVLLEKKVVKNAVHICP